MQSIPFSIIMDIRFEKGLCSMLYNREQYHKIRNQKRLRKIKKNWVVISMALLGIGGTTLATKVSANADTNSDNHSEKVSGNLNHSRYYNIQSEHPTYKNDRMSANFSQISGGKWNSTDFTSSQTSSSAYREAASAANYYGGILNKASSKASREISLAEESAENFMTYHPRRYNSKIESIINRGNGYLRSPKFKSIENHYSSKLNRFSRDINQANLYPQFVDSADASKIASGLNRADRLADVFDTEYQAGYSAISSVASDLDSVTQNYSNYTNNISPELSSAFSDNNDLSYADSIYQNELNSENSIVNHDYVSMVGSAVGVAEGNFRSLVPNSSLDNQFDSYVNPIESLAASKGVSFSNNVSSQNSSLNYDFKYRNVGLNSGLKSDLSSASSFISHFSRDLSISTSLINRAMSSASTIHSEYPDGIIPQEPSFSSSAPSNSNSSNYQPNSKSNHILPNGPGQNPNHSSNSSQPVQPNRPSQPTNHRKSNPSNRKPNNTTNHGKSSVNQHRQNHGNHDYSTNKRNQPSTHGSGHQMNQRTAPSSRKTNESPSQNQSSRQQGPNQNQTSDNSENGSNQNNGDQGYNSNNQDQQNNQLPQTGDNDNLSAEVTLALIGMILGGLGFIFEKRHDE